MGSPTGIRCVVHDLHKGRFSWVSALQFTINCCLMDADISLAGAQQVF